MIDLRDLEKRYGETQALRGVSFEASRGEILGVLGPNGAGKTSCLRILCGYLEADAGSVRVDGIDVGDNPVEARARLGYLPETNPLYPEMRVDEYLTYRAGLKGCARAERRAEVARAMERCGLGGAERRLIGALSKGYRQRVGIADALLRSPPLIVLDEPSVGLDPNQVAEVRTLVRELREDHTVLLSSHVLSEIEQVCDRVVVFSEGRVVAEQEIGSLQESRGTRVIVEIREGQEEPLSTALESAGRISKRESLPGGWIRLTLESDADTRERIGEAALARGIALRQLSLERRSLEEVFRSLTIGEDAS